ncbi:hypothetical protein BKA56DRAFT_565980 [Ilyonectria sp. MPI-CAGE-AT-0026]|nr:hypothetical protein BKA56DRAFT_565980 [Ilyonectria sp. MPI-CAGE-AT-0026]
MTFGMTFGFGAINFIILLHIQTHLLTQILGVSLLRDCPVSWSPSLSHLTVSAHQVVANMEPISQQVKTLRHFSGSKTCRKGA